jgi:ABC-2 type transport system ATP-binding protein
MSEMEDTAEHVVVIGRGRLIADTGIRDFIKTSSGNHLRVVSPSAPQLRVALEAAGATVEPDDGAGALTVWNMEGAQVGEIAAANRFVLHELSPQRASLEEAFIELTRDAVQYRAGEAAPTPAASSDGGKV